jgi:hypothetical protein
MDTKAPVSIAATGSSAEGGVNVSIERLDPLLAGLRVSPADLMRAYIAIGALAKRPR